MQSIRRRLKVLSKTFPPPTTEPDRLSAAAFALLSEEDLLRLLDVIEKLESSPVPPLTEAESQAVEAYDKALKFTSQQARFNLKSKG